MPIEEKKIGKYHCFIIEGNLGHELAYELYEKMRTAITRGDLHLIVDLENCCFVSSGGIGTIASILMVARSRGGDLKIRKPQTAVLNLLNLTKLDEILEVVDEIP